MTLNKKFSAILAVLVVGFFSIYATNLVFTSSNQTNSQLNITLNMQSGAQIPVALGPGQNLPTNLNGDQVVAITVFGNTVPAGANIVMPGTPAGTIAFQWNMAGSTAMGVAIGNPGSNGWPDTEEVG